MKFPFLDFWSRLIVKFGEYTDKSIRATTFRIEDYDLKVKLTSQFSNPRRRAKARRSRSAATGGWASVAQARDPTAADRRCVRRARIYLARFQTTSSVAPEGVRGLMNFSSSAVREVINFLCSPPKFANVLPSSLTVMTLSLSLTEYVPK